MPRCIHNTCGAKPTRWTYYSHHHNEVERAFLENINSVDSETIYQFHNQGLSNLKSQIKHQSPENYDLLEEYFLTFNKIFFFGALSSRTSLQIILKDGPTSEEWEDNYRLIPRNEGGTHDSRSTVPRGRAESHITIYEQENPLHKPSRLLGYIGTLLHEMVHAFICLYTCYCTRCRHNFISQEGQSGHGTTWHAITTVLGSVVIEKLGLNVDLGIEAAMADEWWRSGVDLRSVDLRGLSYRAIAKRVRDLEDMNGEDGENMDPFRRDWNRI